MRQLLPQPGDVDPVVAYLAAARVVPAGRPWVTVGMIASLDGATAVDGRSGALGGPADKAVFRAVRAIADVILVAAGTVRAEHYRPVVMSDAVIAARVAAGRDAAVPRLAIVTRSLNLDLSAPLFCAGPPPLVFTSADADPAALARTAAVTDVVTCGVGDVDLRAAVIELGHRGADVVVAEGGPSLNGELAQADLVDEWCVSIAPAVVGGESHRMVHQAPTLDARYRLASLLTEDDLLFGRWVRTEPVAG